MINLYNSHITDILPPALAKDPKTQALSYALNRAMQRMIDYSRNISVYATIDTLPEQILDLLALELNTQYYDDSLSIEIKRNLIKNTLKWYMSTGTLAAVEEAVTAVFGAGEVQEWFDYGGEPYYFKIYTSTMNTTDEMIQQITDIVSSVQNVRSQLEEVIVEAMQRSQIYFGSIVEASRDSTTIGIDMNIDIAASINQIVLLADAESKIVYELSVADGKLTMEEATRLTADLKQSLLFSDAKTKGIYEVKVVDGKLTMEEVTTVSDEVKVAVLMADVNTGKVYALSVYDGKLTMN